MSKLTEQDLAALRALDTPTICNALEVVAGSRLNTGFTVEPLVCPFPDLPPIVGYARTGSIRSQFPSAVGGNDAAKLRVSYYDYVAHGGPAPQIVVLQDLDGPRAGFGAFWGEVNSNIHKALGCLGVVTDGCIRDIPDWADGFQAVAGSIKPAHAHVHVVSYGGQVSVAGMIVNDGDLVHADQHGAAVIPIDQAREVPKAAAEVAAKEKIVLDVCRGSGFTFEKLKRAMLGPEDVH